MTISGIPSHLWERAALLPQNAHAKEALQRLAGARTVEPANPDEISSKLAETSDGLSSLRLTLYGAPRTKKTSNQLQRFGGRLKVVPSAAWMKWRDDCLPQVNDSMRLRDQPYNLCAIFYRDANRGDAVGYLQGVADVLQEAGVVSDDKWFTQFDGTRLRVDRKRPRVEIVLCAVEDYCRP